MSDFARRSSKIQKRLESEYARVQNGLLTKNEEFEKYCRVRPEHNHASKYEDHGDPIGNDATTRIK